MRAFCFRFVASVPRLLGGGQGGTDAEKLMCTSVMLSVRCSVSVSRSRVRNLFIIRFRRSLLLYSDVIWGQVCFVSLIIHLTRVRRELSSD